MGTKDYLLQQTAFQKRVSTSGPPLVRFDVLTVVKMLIAVDISASHVW
jgi:hypothetical protein